jgi:hypothetical protein
MVMFGGLRDWLTTVTVMKQIISFILQPELHDDVRRSGILATRLPAIGPGRDGKIF